MLGTAKHHVNNGDGALARVFLIFFQIKTFLSTNIYYKASLPADRYILYTDQYILKIF